MYRPGLSRGGGFCRGKVREVGEVTESDGVGAPPAPCYGSGKGSNGRGPWKRVAKGMSGGLQEYGSVRRSHCDCLGNSTYQNRSRSKYPVALSNNQVAETKTLKRSQVPPLVGYDLRLWQDSGDLQTRPS